MNDTATTFEDFSSEIYLCIFDYLDIYSLYKGFLNLNSTFSSILNDKHLLLILDTCYSPKENQIPRYAIPRVRSLTSVINNLLLPNYFHDQIERITFTGTKMTLSSFENIFKKLDKLPHFSSLILTVSENELYNEVCNMILLQNYLPQLKIFTCNAIKYNFDDSLLAENQLTSLTVSCTITDLYRILICSPHLTYVNLSILYSPSSSSNVRLIDLKLSQLKRAKINITWDIGYDHLEDVLRPMSDLKYLKLVGTMLAVIFNNGHNLKKLFSSKLDQVKLNLHIVDFSNNIDWMRSQMFDVDCYWHNVKWTKKETDSSQTMQLTALGYQNKN